jgi:uncharacterized PurR-regulated membrane protein YhhQ (DUF165 family)
MLLDTFRFIALVLAALALTMESAHVLELPQKLQYSAEMYAAVNSTLYRYFAIVGSAYQIGAVLAAGLLAFFLRRHRRVYRWRARSCCCLRSWRGAALLRPSIPKLSKPR